MLLAIDVGNTNVSFGLFAGDDDHLVHTWRIATDRRRTEDEYEVILHQLFQRHRIDPGDVDEVAMGTVVPPVRDTLVGVSRNLFRCEPWVLDPAELRAGITLRVDYPSEVGADRIAAGMGALRRYGGPVIVIDFGTATTFDCVTAEGEYVGGAIAPGVEISAEALFVRTAKLPRVELTPPPRAIGRNTNHSLRSGLIFGYVAMVEGLIERMTRELGGPPVTVVGTGGLCPTIARHTEAIQHVVPTLVLEGLQALYRLHRPRAAAPSAAPADGGRLASPKGCA